MKTKVCATCKKRKPIARFIERSDRPGQYHSYCRGCWCDRTKHRYDTDKKYRRSQIKRATSAVREHRKNPVYLAQDRIRSRMYKRRQLSDPVEYAKHLARGRRWTKDNPDKAKQFKHAQPAYRSARSHNRRARELHAAGSFTAADVSKILSAQNHRCFYCGTDITEHPSVDHYIPLARGGSNWPSNLVGACTDCNTRKGMMLPEDFIQQHKEA